ncbi:hypothetical protein LTR91_027081, partial [Friedmanniomyces endolithicus]
AGRSLGGRSPASRISMLLPTMSCAGLRWRTRVAKRRCCIRTARLGWLTVIPRRRRRS